jgi:hypothetical protein
MELRSRTILLTVGALFAVYFPTALVLKHSHVPFDGAPLGAVWRLMYFQKDEASGHSYTSLTRVLRDVSDTQEFPTRSPVVLYEDDKPLGPPHSAHSDISNLGRGRFSHWHTLGFFISTSDNSDPRTNGRKYWAVVPVR